MHDACGTLLLWFGVSTGGEEGLTAAKVLGLEKCGWREFHFSCPQTGRVWFLVSAPAHPFFSTLSLAPRRMLILDNFSGVG